MAKSILQTDKECFICHTTRNLEEHHCTPGCRRKLAEEYGLKVWLCHDCHMAAHNDMKYLTELKQYAQTVFVSKYGTELWMQRFGKNYL